MWRATICFLLVIRFVSAGRQLTDNNMANTQNEDVAAILQEFFKGDLASPLDRSNRLAEPASSHPKSNLTAFGAKVMPCENSRCTLGGDHGAALLHTSSVSSDANGHGYHFNSNGPGKSGLSREDGEGDHGGYSGGDHAGHRGDHGGQGADHRGHGGDHGGHRGDHGGHGGDHGGHGGDHGGHAGLHGGHEGAHGVLERPDKHRSSVLAGWMLVGFMIFNMSSLYLTNSSDLQVKSYTFKTFSLIIAIFLAVLVEKTQHHLLLTACHALGLSHQVEHCIMLKITVSWFLAISASCKHYAHDHPRLFGISEGVITHVAAFMAIETVVGLQEQGAHKVMNEFGPGAPMLGLYLGICVAIVIVMALMVQVGGWVRARYLVGGHGKPEHNEHGHSAPAPANQAKPEQPDGTSALQTSMDETSDLLDPVETEEHLVEHDHSSHAWEHIAAECDMEAWAIVFGALFSLFFQSVLNGGQNVEPWDCEVEAALGKPCLLMTGTQTFFSCISLGAILGFVVFVAQFQQKNKDNYKIYELCNTVEAFGCFSFAFTFHFVLKAVVWKATYDHDLWSSLVTSRALNAAITWPIFVIWILVVDSMIDKGIIQNTGAERIIQGISLSMAVTVEGMYAFAIDTVVHEKIDKYHPSPLTLIASQFFVIVVFFVLLVPAWMQYIVPTAMIPVPKRAPEVDTRTRKDILRSKLSLVRATSKSFSGSGHAILEEKVNVSQQEGQ